VTIEAGSDEDTPTPPADQCPRNSWCLKPAGHRYACQKYASKRDRERAKSSRKRSASTGSATQRSASRRGRASKPSLMPAVLGLAYGRAGAAVELLGPEPAGPPVGRVMQFQSIAAGEQLDALLSNVPAYKRVTALGSSGLMDSIASLIGAPLLAGLMATNENVARSMWPLLAASLQTSAVAMAKAQKAQLDAMEQVSEYDAEAHAMLDELFTTLFASRPEPANEDHDA